MDRDKVKIKSQYLLYLAQIVILAAVYFSIAKVGLSLASFQGIVTLVWPPAGIALAALLLFGYRLWPGIALGALLANLSAGASLAALGISLGNTLAAVAGAYLLNRFIRLRSSLERLRDVLGLVFLGAMASTTISATIGVASLGLAGAVTGASYGSVWWVWWLGDVMSVLVVAPVLLTWSHQPRLAMSPRRVVEAVVLLAALVIVGEFVFGGFYISQVTNYPLVYIFFPFVIWAAFRFGQRGAVTVTLVTASLAVWGTVQGIGPFVQGTIDTSLLLLHGFIGTMAITAMLLAAALVERKRAEEALEEQRAFLRQVIDINPHHIFAKDQEGRFTLVNQTVAGVYNTTIEHLIGKTDVDFSPDVERVEHFQRDDLEVIHSGQEKFIAEEFIVDGAGQIRWLQTIKRPILGSDGRVQQILGVATDITERKRVEQELHKYKEYLEELVQERTLELTEAVEQLEQEITERRHAEEVVRESEARLRTIGDNLPGGVIYQYILEPDGRHYFTYLSSGIERLAGIRAQEALPDADKLHSLFLEEDRVRIKQATLESAANLTLFDIEARRRLPAGEIRWSHYRSAPRRLPNGATVWDGVELDITERKQVEAALRESERRLFHFLEAVPIGVFVIDARGKPYYANQASQQLLGQGIIPNLELGQIAEVYHAYVAGTNQIYPLDRAPLARALAGETVTTDDIEIHQPGRIIILEVTATPIFDPNGTIEYAMAVFQDITARKQAEEALRQYAAELQVRNEELDAFAHTVAHDLKAPLGPITGYADILNRDVGILIVEERHKFLQAIARNGRKMNNIIDELLLLASVRKKEIEPSPLDMADIVAEAQQRLAHLIEEHQAEIILPAVWPVALGYAPWIEEVWANYLNNAIKYGGRPPRLELGATVIGQDTSLPPGEQQNPSFPMARFWVRDNGPGLSLEAQQRLFIPFTQLGQVRATGQGLGLSIVQRIVEKLGGQVGVESDGVPGQGSTFSFTLPRL